MATRSIFEALLSEIKRHEAVAVENHLSDQASPEAREIASLLMDDSRQRLIRFVMHCSRLAEK